MFPKTLSLWAATNSSIIILLMKYATSLLFAIISLSNLSCVGTSSSVKMKESRPKDLGLSAEYLAYIDKVVMESIDRGDIPGAVVLVGHRGRVVYRKAFGNRSLEPVRKPMKTDTVFDLASLTKPVATATSIMLLEQMNMLDINDRVSEYIPEFAKNGKAEITIRQLLLHNSGLPFEDNIDNYKQGNSIALNHIYSLQTDDKPGEKFIYSGIGYIVLSELVHRVAGMDLAEFSKLYIFEPLGMKDSSFNPGWRLRRRSAPTELRDGRWLMGRVEDPRAEHLGGVAGHAGLFSTVDDMAIFSQMLLNGGTYNGVKILEPRTIKQMITPQSANDGLNYRGLGWDILSEYSHPRGKYFLPGSFGHTGFSGTSMWIDPYSETFILIFTNRVHLLKRSDISELRRKIANIIAHAVYLKTIPDT